MKPAVVIGQIAPCVIPDWNPDKLLLVEMIDRQGVLTVRVAVATDSIGAGNGEWVLIVSGSSAACQSKEASPVDLSIIGIVDEAVMESQVIFHK